MSEHRFPSEVADGFESTARMWIDIYSELLRFVRKARLDAIRDGVGGEVTRVWEQKERDFEARLRFWGEELGRSRQRG